MGLVENTLIGLTITLAAFEGLLHIIHSKPKTNKPTAVLPSHGDDENNRIITAAAATGPAAAIRKSDRSDGNVSIVWKDNSFLIIMVVFTCIGYLMRMLPIGAVFHLVCAITMIYVILKVLSKHYVVTFNWLHGSIYINAEIRMKFLPKFKLTRSYKIPAEMNQ